MQKNSTPSQNRVRAGKIAAAKHWGDQTERFLRRVNKRGPNECWPFMGTARNGYGAIVYNGRTMQAHRVAFLIANGELDDVLDVCHTCDNPICCNPAHLWQGTAHENIRDCISKGRFHAGRVTGDRWAKLTPDQVVWVRINYKPWKFGAQRIADSLGVSKGCIQSILRGNSWKHIKAGSQSAASLNGHPQTRQD